ncbi:COG4315 family predicted lipoprotein [Frigidibacter oleivorans]|uniref:COG4315 family predicted lipoprotein n=1 Tax=Frigidibacter oleivorans TaxID=2487129 RepID=UPI000F8F4CEA|nr:hypothetical protein [Frigidibacter oleivorans]
MPDLRSACLVLALSAVLPLPAAAAPAMTGGSALGPVLTDARGMTLYIFDEDRDGQSACYDACAVNWPPLLAEAGAVPEGDFTLSPRKDGAMQWTLRGQPLYTWIKDAAPGDVTGDGVKGVWHAAKP